MNKKTIRDNLNEREYDSKCFAGIQAYFLGRCVCPFNFIIVFIFLLIIIHFNARYSFYITLCKIVCSRKTTNKPESRKLRYQIAGLRYVTERVTSICRNMQ